MRFLVLLIIFTFSYLSNSYAQSLGIKSNLNSELQKYEKNKKPKAKRGGSINTRKRINLEGEKIVAKVQEVAPLQEIREDFSQNFNEPKIREIPLDEIKDEGEEYSTEYSEDSHNEADFAASTVAEDTQRVIPSAVLEIIRKHKVHQGDISLLVQNIARNNPMVSLNPEVLRKPASTTKLLTTAAGLLKMGADYKWNTDFYIDTRPNADGILNGDLFIKGGGDPFLVEERLEEIIQALRQSGIRHINGNIVLDSSLYKLKAEERNTEIFDGNPYSAYNAIPAPFMVNFNSVKIIFTPIGKGRVDIALSPNIKNWRIKNQLKINSGKCSQNYSPKINFERDSSGYADLTITGLYSLNCGRQELNAVLGESTELFYYLFKELWTKHGGSIDGGGKYGSIPVNANLILSAPSLPLSEAITKMNTFSNNVMTRQLMLTLGAYVYGEPGDLEKGRDALKNTLSEFGVNMKGAFIDNGSGLSRETVVSAQMFNQLLVNMYRSQVRKVFVNSLAVAGQTGTLRKRMRGSVLEGNVVGKTGTIKGVRSFAGYVFAKSGAVYAVVIIGNGKSAGAAKGMQDDLFNWIYRQ